MEKVIIYGDGACIYAFTTQSNPTGISVQNCLKLEEILLKW